MSLGDLADRALERLGDHVFVAQGDARSLLSEVVDRAGRVAGGLRGSGVAPGDRVGVVMTNSPDVLVAYLAIWRAGAVAMPVIPAVTAAELEHVLRDSEARVVLCSPASEDLVASAGAAEVVPSLDRLLEDAAPVVARGDDELAALLYTGGTTGRAKGVMLTHRNLDQTARARAQVVATAGTSDVLVPLPMSHVFGLINAVSRLHVPTPGTLHLQGRFDAAEWVRIVARERVEASAVVPSMLQLLLGQPLENADLSSLTYITSGGAPLALAVRQEVERRIPTARVCDGYGCTEVCSTATMNPPDARRDDSVGTPLPGVRLRIAADGEVLVSSPGVMAGYWRDPEATADAVQDGWLRTGDVGRLDEDGYLYVVDRIKDLIIRGGFNVYPRDVEDALLEHPAVLAAAVVGRPDPVLGEEVVAYVQLGAPASPAELLAFAAERLAATKRPRELHVVDRVPLTSVGKTDRKAVRLLLG
ncbi:MAG: putative acyl-CoA synthetase [Frankiales bacterium]|jgi:long-chain acyl-CoA synthetase|nr:putative acyl-CoA synthetase [Frankiales bacterium]